MKYTDFANKKDHNAPRGVRINRNALRYSAAALGMGAFILGYAYGTPEKKAVNWYNVTASDKTVAQCSAMENDGMMWSDYLDAVKAKNPGIEKTNYQVKNLTLQDTDGDGKVCGKPVRKE